MGASIEIPDALFRRLQLAALARGLPLKQFVADVLTDKVDSGGLATEAAPIGDWRLVFGKLSHLSEELARVNKVIEEEFEEIDLEDPV